MYLEYLRGVVAERMVTVGYARASREGKEQSGNKFGIERERENGNEAVSVSYLYILLERGDSEREVLVRQLCEFSASLFTVGGEGEAYILGIRNRRGKEQVCSVLVLFSELYIFLHSDRVERIYLHSVGYSVGIRRVYECVLYTEV